MHYAAYQSDGCLVQYPSSHLVDDVRVARDADIGDQSVQRAPLHTRYRLGLGRCYRGLHLAVTAVGDDFAHVPQLVDIEHVDGQLVIGESAALGRLLGVCPALECPGTRVYNRVGLGTGEIRGKGHVETQIDLVARHCWVRRHGMGLMRVANGPLHGSRGHHGLFVRLGPSEAHGRSHLLPAMSSLASEVVDLVHLMLAVSARTRLGTSVRKAKV